MHEEAIAAVRSALGELNRALSALPALGIEVEVNPREHTLISWEPPGTRITLHLSRTKTEIDVHL